MSNRKNVRGAVRTERTGAALTVDAGGHRFELPADPPAAALTAAALLQESLSTADPAGIVDSDEVTAALLGRSVAADWRAQLGPELRRDALFAVVKAWRLNWRVPV